MKIKLILSKANLALSRQEALTALKDIANSTIESENILTLDTDASTETVKRQLSRLAYTKKAFQINGKTSLIWENKEDFNSRKAHKMPGQHPTAMDPRLARALVNISGAKKEILDPFCGAAGILIEAAILKLEPIGIDIDKRMLERAKLNLNHLKLQAELHNMDALEWKHTAEAVITDVPYGKNSTITASINSLIEEFLTKYSSITNKIILAYPKGAINEQLFNKTGWKDTNNYSIYIHKSLTKRISILHRS